MMTLLSLYWKPIGIFVLTGLLMTYIGFIRHERDSAIADREALKLQNATLKLDIQTWQSAVEQQNAKIDNMNHAYEAMTQRVNDAKQQIQHMNVEAQVKLEALKHYYESIPDSDSCEAVKRILNAQVPPIH